MYLARDLPFCGGNCEIVDPTLPAQVASLFPNASKFEAVVIPGAGHALNLVRILLGSKLMGVADHEQHYSRQTTYAAILDFFDTLTI